jgi:sulfane dehydrogenase subunit SoxC
LVSIWPDALFYEISGLSWSGNGRINKVEVSADGGKSFALAALQTPVLSKALTRFRMPWNWDGAPAVLLSRATEAGNVQPSRAAFLAERGQPKASPPPAASCRRRRRNHSPMTKSMR